MSNWKILSPQNPWEAKALGTKGTLEGGGEAKNKKYILRGCEVGLLQSLLVPPLKQIRCLLSWETDKEAPASRSLGTSVKEVETHGWK